MGNQSQTVFSYKHSSGLSQGGVHLRTEDAQIALVKKKKKNVRPHEPFDETPAHRPLSPAFNLVGPMLQLSCASTSIFNIASPIMAKESLQRQTASYWKIMGLELPELYSLSTLNYVFGVSFCSYAIKIFTFTATDIFIPVVLHEIIQHV